MIGSKRHRPVQKTSAPRSPRYGPERQSGEGFLLTPEKIGEYMTFYRSQGGSEDAARGCQRKLQKLYDDLPEDKLIRRGTMDLWREQLAGEGYAPSTINGFLSAGNTFLEFAGHREYQVSEKVKTGSAPQPELSRTEYLRLLQAAKLLQKEKGYLLVKLFATTPLNVQELPKVTAEAVGEGQVVILQNGVKTLVRFPKYLREELTAFARREGRISGPLFVTREGKALNRTYVCTIIRQLCKAAQVPEEKGNPRCLRRLYQSTQATIESNIALLVEQAMERQLEMEQMSVGWEA